MANRKWAKSFKIASQSKWERAKGHKNVSQAKHEKGKKIFSKENGKGQSDTNMLVIVIRKQENDTKMPVRKKTEKAK